VLFLMIRFLCVVTSCCKRTSEILKVVKFELRSSVGLRNITELLDP
jgi:hypothetical protein